jgi:hypothetical protein
LEILRDEKWYFSRGCYYLRINTEDDKDHIYFDSSLDMVTFWIRQIQQAKEFHHWY